MRDRESVDFVYRAWNFKTRQPGSAGLKYRIRAYATSRRWNDESDDLGAAIAVHTNHLARVDPRQSFDEPGNFGRTHQETA